MANTKTVLIIEDDAPLRFALASKCALVGLGVLEALDGESGLQLALTKHPDLILLDLLLPVRDGMSLLTELRKDSWGRNAVVMILSNLSDTGTIAEGMEHHVFEYRVKSDVAIDEVVESMKTRLGLGGTKK